MSNQRQQQQSQTNSMFEGYGGPINMNKYDITGIDPTLAACCQKEVRLHPILKSILYYYLYNYDMFFVMFLIHFLFFAFIDLYKD